LSEKRLHEKLKSFLIEVGQKEGYKSFSGDSECLDIRLKKKRIEYKPDVIWKSKTSCHVFEIAFTEDWRAIVGEFTLAWLAMCSTFIVFALTPCELTKTGERNGIPSYMAVFLEKQPYVYNLFGFLGSKFGMKWHYIPVISKTARKADVTDIRTYLFDLKEWNLITEETYRSYFK
jgi:hypothetical protein